MARPLDGIRIVDVTEGAQGPWGIALLSDLGAEVIKVEKPEGEMMRNGVPSKKGIALPNSGMNHGKRNIVLNLKDPKDREILLQLVAKADVFAENWRAGVASRLSVDYETLSQINPRLIYLSASGFGQKGKYSHKGTVDNISQAMGGYFSITGPKGGIPEKPRFIVIDFTSPLTVAQGILLGLLAREETGKGQWIQCSQLETLISLSSTRAAEYFMNGKTPEPMGSECVYSVPCQAFMTADTHIMVDCPNEETWKALCRTLLLPGLADDPKYDSNAKRVENRDELLPILKKAFLRYRGERWLEKLEAAGVPCGPVSWDIEDLYDNPQVVANGLLVDRQHRIAGRVRTNEVPWILSRTPAVYGPLAAEMDEDREDILAELGTIKEKAPVQ